MQTPTEHLDAHEVEAYVKNSLPEQDRVRVESHLKHCANCRGDVAALSHVMNSQSNMPNADIQRGDTIAHFRINKVLGVGGMGQVYEAFDTNLARTVAIKIVRPTESNRKRSLLHEAQMMARVSPHDNLVVVHEAGTHRDHVYIVMEKVNNGETLRDWLDRESYIGRLTIASLIEVYSQAGNGLEAAHEAGIVHLDFKPENVIVGESPRFKRRVVKVGDFGLAKAFPGASFTTPPNERMGTPAYAPPEAYDSRQEIDGEKYDQYAWAASFFTSICGCPPNTLRSQEAVAAALRDSPLIPPKWLQSLLLKALDENPKQRFHDMHTLLSVMNSHRFRRKRSFKWASAAALALMMGAYLVAEAQRTGAKCELAAWDDAWPVEQQKTVKDAFLRTDVPDASNVFQRVSSQITQYVDSWRDAAQRVCSQRTHVTTSQNEQRVLCLEMHRSTYRYARNNLHAADRKTVHNAQRAISTLIDPLECLKQYPLKGPYSAEHSSSSQEEEAKQRRIYSDLLERLEQVKIMRKLGKLDSAELEAAALRAEAEELGQRHAKALIGAEQLEIAMKQRKYEDLERLTEEVADIGVAARNIDVYAKAKKRRLWLMGRKYEDLEASEPLARVLEDLLWDSRGISQETLAHIYASLASNHDKHGRKAEAVESMQKAVEIRRGLFGPSDYRVAAALHNLGVYLQKAEQYEEAALKHELAAITFRDYYGDHNRRVVLALAAQGKNLLEQGLYVSAQNALLSAKELGDELPAKGPVPALVRALLGDVAYMLSDFELSRELHSDALRVFLEMETPSYAQTTMARIGLARLYADEGQCQMAVPEIATSIEVLEGKPAERPLLGEAYFLMARCSASAKTGRDWAEKALTVLQAHATGSEGRTLAKVKSWMSIDN